MRVSQIGWNTTDLIQIPLFSSTLCVVSVEKVKLQIELFLCAEENTQSLHYTCRATIASVKPASRSE